MDSLCRHYKRIGCLFLGLVLLGSAAARVAPAAGLDPSKRLTQYSLRTWGLDEGLPQSTVNALAQDGHGYLWVGTRAGLVRFDGVRFVPFGQDHGLPSRPVTGLANDSDGALWVASGGRLFRSRGGGFVEVLHDGERVTGADHLFARQAGGVWVARRQGTLLWASVDAGAEEFRNQRGEPLSGVSAVVEFDGSSCFAATEVFCHRGGAVEPWVRESSTQQEPFPVDSLAAGGGGSLWAGTLGGGLWRGRHGRLGRVPLGMDLDRASITALRIDREDTLWAGLLSTGLVRLASASEDGTQGRIERGLPMGFVRTMMLDRDGNLWIGTNTSGLMRLTDPPVTTFSVPEGLPLPTVHSVLESRDGRVWLGSQGGGLVEIDSELGIVIRGPEDGLPNSDVMGLARDQSGALLVATAGGVARLQGDVFQPLPAVGNPVAFTVFEDTAGRRWGGFLDGLKQWDGERFESLPWGDGRQVVSIEESADGTLWFGTMNEGLIRYRQQRVETIAPAEPFPVLSLLADGEDLWIGTHSLGLGRLSADGTYRGLGSAEGLCDDDIYSLLEDGLGRLWMSSDRGVFVIDIEDAMAVLEGRAAKLSCRRLGTADGLRTPEASGGLQPSAWRTADGGLWFATIDGVARVDPKRIFRPTQSSHARIETVRSAGAEIEPRMDGSVLLVASQRTFAIEYTALDLASPEKLEFRYRLADLETEWTESGARRTAFFSHLRPGEYTFEVAARSQGGGWSEPARLALELQPLFRETAFFPALLASGALILVTTIHRLRLAHLGKRQRELEWAVESRTRELESARIDLQQANVHLERRVQDGVAALRQSDRMAAYGHLVSGVAHELRHPIFTLRTAAHLLVAKSDGSSELSDELALLESEGDRIGLLLDDLLELSRPPSATLLHTEIEPMLGEAIRSHEAAFADSAESAPKIECRCCRQLPPVAAEREKLLRIFLNLLNNVRRHAPSATCIRVEASVLAADAVPGARVRISISDDGEGIPLARQTDIFEPFVSGDGGTGLGLAIARNIVEAHRGTIRLESEPGQGANFVVELPAAQ